MNGFGRTTSLTVALDQLELPIDGVEPLSPQERVQRWLEDQDETPASLAGWLFLRDEVSRQGRAQRWAKLRDAERPFHSESGWLVPGGVEAVWLHDEAGAAYVAGFHLAALLCAHAACERVLAGCLDAYREQLDKNWLWWGLGRLVNAAADRNLIDEPLRKDLAKVAELRKVTAHYKPPTTPNTVTLRALASARPDEQRSDDDLLDEVLEGDALFALTVATRLIRGDEGFSRVRYY